MNEDEQALFMADTEIDRFLTRERIVTRALDILDQAALMRAYEADRQAEAEGREQEDDEAE